MSWQGVELRHLQAFLAVYDERSFGRAAEALGYSQGAVSQQIAALEKAIGLPLFERPGGPRPIEPTDAARELLPRARAVFAELAAAEDSLTAVRDGERGRLAIGSFESVSVAFLPAVVARLRGERPDVELELIEEAHDHLPLIERVLAGDLHAAFVPEDRHVDGLVSTRLLADPYVAVLPRRPDEAVVTLEEVGVGPLVGHIDEDICQAQVNLALRANGVTPNYVFRSSDNGALQAMVRSGLGAAIMPRLAVDPTDTEVSIVPTDPPIPPRAVCLIRRADMRGGPVLDRFVEIVDEVAGEFRARLGADSQLGSDPS